MIRYESLAKTILLGQPDMSPLPERAASSSLSPPASAAPPSPQPQKARDSPEKPSALEGNSEGEAYSGLGRPKNSVTRRAHVNAVPVPVPCDRCKHRIDERNQKNERRLVEGKAAQPPIVCVARDGFSCIPCSLSKMKCSLVSNPLAIDPRRKRKVPSHKPLKGTPEDLGPLLGCLPPLNTNSEAQMTPGGSTSHPPHPPHQIAEHPPPKRARSDNSAERDAGVSQHPAPANGVQGTKRPTKRPRSNRAAERNTTGMRHIANGSGTHLAEPPPEHIHDNGSMDRSRPGGHIVAQLDKAIRDTRALVDTANTLTISINQLRDAANNQQATLEALRTSIVEEDLEEVTDEEDGGTEDHGGHDDEVDELEDSDVVPL